MVLAHVVAVRAVMWGFRWVVVAGRPWVLTGYWWEVPIPHHRVVPTMAADSPQSDERERLRQKPVFP